MWTSGIHLLIALTLIVGQGSTTPTDATVDLPSLPIRDADFDSVKTHLHKGHVKATPQEPDKYFHESTFSPHYDGRFADRVLNYEEQNGYLQGLVRTYLSAMNDIGVETFIMHGTLVGWWWNRKILPWDSDIDVMVSETSMYHMAQYYNMTVHHYLLPNKTTANDYLLEINPRYDFTGLDPSNHIDARWIDMETGLFIDITTLRRDASADALGVDGALMVKDTHHYLYDDIYPLRESTIEGVPVLVPFNYAKIVTEEYGQKALTRDNFANHHFDQEKKLWVPLPGISSQPKPAFSRGRGAKPGRRVGNPRVGF